MEHASFNSHPATSPIHTSTRIYTWARSSVARRKAARTALAHKLATRSATRSPRTASRRTAVTARTAHKTGS